MALIRKEVAESRATQHYGAVVLAVERSSSMILLVALGFICAALALASSFSYTSRVQVSGLVDGADATPRALLFVPLNQMSRVKIGQSVSLRLAGYAPGAAGRITGTVSGIADVTSVTVAIDAGAARDRSANIPLHKGMRLDADIDVERHRLIAWLFRPVLHILDRID